MGSEMCIRDSTSPVIGEAIGAVTVVAGTGWWPNPLHDQHLAGDLLWFIAEGPTFRC